MNPAPTQVALRIVMPVTRMLADDDLDIFLDGQPIGRGSYNKGVNLSVITLVGSHTLEIGQDVSAVGGTIFSSFSTRQFRKTWKLSFGVSGHGEQVATLRYSRAWGNFKVEVR